MAENTTKTTKTEKVAMRQVNARIPEDVFLDLEGYAYGTRRKPSDVVRQAILDFYDSNKDEILAKKVD